MSATDTTDVLLVGFGAIGVIYAHVLERSGRARVTAVARSNYEAIKRDGMHIMSDKYGDIPSWRPHRLYPSVQEALDRPYSYVVLATKALPEIAPTSSILSPLLSPKYTHRQPAYVLFQNGLGVENDIYDAASKLVRDGKPRILSCTLHIGTNLLSDNVVQHNVLDRIVMGLYKHGNFTDVSQTPEEIELLNDFGGMLIAGGSEVTLVPEIQRYRFRKNFWNLAFSSVATLSRYPLRAIFQQPRVEATAVPVIRAIMLENLAVGRAMGLDEDAVPSSVIDDTIKSTGNFHRKPDSKHKASMLLDCETGRPMEIEVIVGEVLRKAKELGVETPRIESLYALLVIIQGQLLKGGTKQDDLQCA
ncbi:hypothetical protein ACEPAH_7550 [Sanghuangporus vaninii]